jgi:hypothetical protein
MGCAAIGMLRAVQIIGLRKDGKVRCSERQRLASQPRRQKNRRRRLSALIPVPDKVTSKPSLGRGTVSFYTILHDDLKSRAAAAG